MAFSQPPRLAFYSHDTMGLGHIRRNMLLASTVLAAEKNTEILFINGVREAGMFYFPQGMDSITLPNYMKRSDGEYHPRSLGNNVRRLVSLRASIIKATLDSFCPDVVVVDNVPRGTMGELNAVLPALKQRGVQLILGLRDIIDAPETVQRQWLKQDNVSAIRNYYSAVWVYGDETFYDLTHACNLPDDIKRKVSFMGYLDATSQPQCPAEMDHALPNVNSLYILCTVGGGQDGFRLAEAFAHAEFPAGVAGILITGTMMPSAEYTLLQSLASRRHNLHIIRFVANPLLLLQKAHSVIAMGGYNTTMEILSLHKRALIIPRISPRQEQWIRASRLAQLNVVSCIHPEKLTPQLLSAWLSSDWQPANPRDCLRFNGLDTFANKIKALLP